MNKATPIPLAFQFPRRHSHCDCCGKAVSWAAMEALRGERSTCAGSFAYQICYPCVNRIEAMQPERRDAAYAKAMVRHAGYYCPEFAQFVAAWLGVKVPRQAVKPPLAVDLLAA